MEIDSDRGKVTTGEEVSLISPISTCMKWSAMKIEPDHFFGLSKRRSTVLKEKVNIGFLELPRNESNSTDDDTSFVSLEELNDDDNIMSPSQPNASSEEGEFTSPLSCGNEENSAKEIVQLKMLKRRKEIHAAREKKQLQLEYKKMVERDEMDEGIERKEQERVRLQEQEKQQEEMSNSILLSSFHQRTPQTPTQKELADLNSHESLRDLLTVYAVKKKNHDNDLNFHANRYGKRGRTSTWSIRLPKRSYSSYSPSIASSSPSSRNKAWPKTDATIKLWTSTAAHLSASSEVVGFPDCDNNSCNRMSGIDTLTQIALKKRDPFIYNRLKRELTTTQIANRKLDVRLNEIENQFSTNSIITSRQVQSNFDYADVGIHQFLGEIEVESARDDISDVASLDYLETQHETPSISMNSSGNDVNPLIQWIMAFDCKSGKYYWYDRQTRKTTWNRPRKYIIHSSLYDMAVGKREFQLQGEMEYDDILE